MLSIFGEAKEGGLNIFGEPLRQSPAEEPCPDCPICFESCDLNIASKGMRRAVVVTSCSHVFHMGCIAEHYARDPSHRCPICRADLDESELVSPASSLPSDLESVMRDDSLRHQIVSLIGSCVNQALKWDRRRVSLIWLAGVAATFVWVSNLEATYVRQIRRLQKDYARLCLENRELRQWNRLPSLLSLFRRPA